MTKINAVRYAFLELGVENGVIVARTDSLGASLTQKIPITKTKGDLAWRYEKKLRHFRSYVLISGSIHIFTPPHRIILISLLLSTNILNTNLKSFFP